jgi:hypothetical protein
MPFMVTLRLDEDDIDRVIAALEQHAALSVVKTSLCRLFSQLLRGTTR